MISRSEVEVQALSRINTVHCLHVNGSTWFRDPVHPLHNSLLYLWHPSGLGTVCSSSPAFLIPMKNLSHRPAWSIIKRCLHQVRPPSSVTLEVTKAQTWGGGGIRQWLCSMCVCLSCITSMVNVRLCVQLPDTWWMVWCKGGKCNINASFAWKEA